MANPLKSSSCYEFLLQKPIPISQILSKNLLSIPCNTECIFSKRISENTHFLRNFVSYTKREGYHLLEGINMDQDKGNTTRNIDEGAYRLHNIYTKITKFLVPVSDKYKGSIDAMMSCHSDETTVALCQFSIICAIFRNCVCQTLSHYLLLL